MSRVVGCRGISFCQVAPLGLSFFPEVDWPDGLRNNLLVVMRAMIVLGLKHMFPVALSLILSINGRYKQSLPLFGG